MKVFNGRSDGFRVSISGRNEMGDTQSKAWWQMRKISRNHPAFRHAFQVWVVRPGQIQLFWVMLTVGAGGPSAKACDKYSTALHTTHA